MELDNEWEEFLLNANDYKKDSFESTNNKKDSFESTNNNLNDIKKSDKTLNIPKATDLYISTKTKIIYLSEDIDIYTTFWKIPIIDYNKQDQGIIKKQIKLSCDDKEKFQELEKVIDNDKNIKCNIIKHIDNPSGRIIFKDIRKITIGLSKKDILYNKIKDKSAFYNCFVITIRIDKITKFKEYHVKIFNTGKLEIPGLQNDNDLDIIISKILILLNNVNNNNIKSINTIENVLINSNFNCGYYINREKLFNILRYKYNINANYDPCSYPGIQCVYYENDTKISYMIFRTGSILIVGKCSEIILNDAYNFIKNILINEYVNINVENTKILNVSEKKTKVHKPKKRFIYIES